MSVRTWLQPPHRLLALFLVITLAPSAMLLAFGWRLLAQERELQLQETQERREQAADLGVSLLEQLLVATERALRDPGGVAQLANPDEAVAVVIDGDRIAAFPPGRLLYYPRRAAGLEAPSHVFDPGEALELRVGDAAGAAAWFRRVARSDNPAIRAGALIRQARSLRKAGRADLALAAYGEAAGISGALTDGLPADLLARWARGSLLETLRRDDELRHEAAALRRDLLAGRWHIDRPTYELHLADTGRWLGSAALTPPPAARALTAAVEWLWQESEQTQRSGREGAGRRQITFADTPVTVLWQAGGDRFTALAAGPRYVADQWLAKAAAALERQQLRIGLRDPASAAEPGETRRSARETGLPWTVAVHGLAAHDDASRLTAWQRLWFAGLAVVVLFASAGTYVIGRAMSHELAVARLQTDFVAAVSHEFRTPLTSLRQLTELLLDRPDTPPERRRSYYEALGRQTERLHRLVESLLDFGRMEAGTSPYRLQPVDVAGLVRSVCDQFQSEVSARGHLVALEPPTAAAIVAADREALTNAIWNLLDNAVKYSPESKTVWVTVEREGPIVRIGVRDAGLGIPRGEQREIFHKFFRGAAARAGNITGTGIGLAMVRHIVAAHRGRVTVRSEPGVGSTFAIELPVEESCPGS